MFNVGHRARWRASQFDAATVMDEQVAGESADPDADGLDNLAEYALGGQPRTGIEPHPVSGEPVAVLPGRLEVAGQWYPTLTFHRRRASDSPEVAYAVEWSDSLAPGSWSKARVEVAATQLDQAWERVTVRGTSDRSSPAP